MIKGEYCLFEAVIFFLLFFYYTWMLSICSSTSFMDILPLKTAATVRYLPCLGSQAAIMFFESNICCVSSGTVRDR